MPEVKVINAKPTAEKQTLKIAAYCRVSSDSADQLNSFAAQINHYTELFQSSQDELCGIYADAGISGTEMKNRDEFQRMLADCRLGKINRVFAKSISRFARNTEECLTVVRELKQLNISVYFEKENIDTGEIDTEMMLTIMSAVAQQESQSISQNVRWGIQRRMKNGTFVSSSVPFGYKLINKELVPYEPEAEVVRKIFELYLNGHGTPQIAKIMLKQDGTQWKRDSIKYILTNERYIGDSLLQKRFSTDTFPCVKKRNNGERDKYYINNTHEPIISREVFDKAYEILNKNAEKYNTSRERKTYPLTSKIYCGECGSTYVRKICRNNICWACVKHDKFSACPAKQIAEKQIHGAFINMFNKLKCNYEHVLIPLLKQLQALEIREASQDVKISELQQEIMRLNEQSHLLTKLKVQGLLDDVMFNEQSLALTRKITELKAEASKCGAKQGFGADEISRLIKILKDNEFMKEFDEELFNDIVIKITADKSLTFRIIGGLEVKEKYEC